MVYDACKPFDLKVIFNFEILVALEVNNTNNTSGIEMPDRRNISSKHQLCIERTSIDESLLQYPVVHIDASVLPTVDYSAERSIRKRMIWPYQRAKITTEM